MLVITRSPRHSDRAHRCVHLVAADGRTTTVEVVVNRQGKVQLLIDAPADVQVVRGELAGVWRGKGGG